jgi:hypothetical protein
MMTPKLSPADQQLADEVANYYAEPLGWVMFAYEWDTDPALQVCELPPEYQLAYGCKYGPDLWACELLVSIGEQVKANGFDGTHAVDAIREAIASGHGIGKSAITAWLVNWLMSTRPFARGTVTATTAVQLATKTWAEIAKWTKKSITGHWFDVTTGKGAMKMSRIGYEEDWFCSAQTCAEENSEAFAGQHSVTSTSFYIFDEASGVPNKIWEVADGGMTDGEPMFFAFGNPTINSGEFYDCFHSKRHRWNTRQIDSRTVQITNKKFLQDMIDDYGIDSDRVKVRVLGIFPSLSALQFISVSDVDEARRRHLRPEQYAFAPVILTLDPAWTGNDELVISKRQGLKFEILRTLDKNDNDMEVATMLAALEDEHEADAVFIDMGYGTGVYSAGITWGRPWQLVNFGAKSPTLGYLNMRAYIYGQGKQWLKDGGALPDDLQLRSEIIAVLTEPRTDGVIQIESKKDMHERVGFSPGRCDSLMLSFAYPVVRKPRLLGIPLRPQAPREYDPYAGRPLDRQPDEYDPYSNIR